MKLETLVKVLVENGKQDLIALATTIDLGIQAEMPDYIVCEIFKDHLPPGVVFEKDRQWGFVRCQVIKCNHYRQEKNYLVLLPDETTKWVSESSNSLTKTIAT